MPMNVSRKLGEAKTSDERDLEESLKGVPQWKGKEISYTMLVGGLMNKNWRVSVENESRRYFVKVPGKGSEAFIDRAAANAAARNASSLGIGPEVIFFNPRTGVEICVFLENYRACTNFDFESAQHQHTVIDRYRRFHGGAPLPLTKTIFDMIDEHVDQANELDGHFPPDFAWLHRHYCDAKSAFLASGLDIVACFNDPIPGNFLVSDTQPMMLIDYEFASNNERTYELGVFFGEMFFDERKIEELTEAYFGSLQPDIIARIHVNRFLADMKWGSWAVLNRKLNDWDFDYQKYGVWKYMRARSVLYDPRWPQWMRTL
jgi:thiamine kinase-like enzyme